MEEYSDVAKEAALPTWLVKQQQRSSGATTAPKLTSKEKKKLKKANKIRKAKEKSSRGMGGDDLSAFL